MKVALGWVAALLIGACVTPPPPPPDFSHFPNGFIATQVVTVHLGSRHRELLAQIKRKGAKLEVVFLEPTILNPILRISNDGGIWSHWYNNDAEERSDGLHPADMMDSISYLYEAVGSQFSAAGSDLLLPGKGKVKQYRLREFTSFNGCYFPRRILLFFQSEQYQLEVITKELACQDTSLMEKTD